MADNTENSNIMQVSASFRTTNIVRNGCPYGWKGELDKSEYGCTSPDICNVDNDLRGREPVQGDYNHAGNVCDITERNKQMGRNANGYTLANEYGVKNPDTCNVDGDMKGREPAQGDYNKAGNACDITERTRQTNFNCKGYTWANQYDENNMDTCNTDGDARGRRPADGSENNAGNSCDIKLRICSVVKNSSRYGGKEYGYNNC